MVFITHCCKSGWHKGLGWLVAAVLLCTGAGLGPAWAASTELAQLQVERSGESVLLSASVRFELPGAVEEALLKGIPVIFVAEADVFRERWYWTNKKVLSAQRHMRLAYQALTQRWRLNIASGPITVTGMGMALTQNFDSLADALAAVQRVSRWKIAEASELEPNQAHNVAFRFRLDVSQLPRPLQIGTLGDPDWDISTAASRAVTEAGK